VAVPDMLPPMGRLETTNLTVKGFERKQL
jgi:hypothetical protein